MSTFLIPSIIQSDQGSNFMSKQFIRALRQLQTRHRISIAYNPQSQGALERFHQTLKSILRAFCVELGLRGRKVFLGCSWPSVKRLKEVQVLAQMSFGHTVCRPSAVLADQWSNQQPGENVLDYVSGFKYRLYEAQATARKMLLNSQCKMQRLFDRKSELQCFEVDDQGIIVCC